MAQMKRNPSTRHLAATRVKRVTAVCSLFGVTAFAAVVASALATPALAQPVQIGVEAGAAFTKVVGPDASFSKRRTGPFGGVTVVVQQPDALLGFQTGLILISKGEALNEADRFDSAFRLRYLEVPLLLRAGKAVRGTGIIPAFTGGVTVGARIGCSVVTSSSETDCNSSGDILFDVDRFEVSTAVGAEVAFPYRKRLLIVPMVRYTRALTTIGDSGGTEVSNDVIQVAIGLRFRR
jgi:hypothetical protein